MGGRRPERRRHQGQAHARSGARISSGEPKTRRSRRPVHLTGVAVETLRSHLERQLEDLERLGHLYRDHGLVFTSGSVPSSTPRTCTDGRLHRCCKGPDYCRYASTTCVIPVRRCWLATCTPSTSRNSWATLPWPSRWTPIPPRSPGWEAIPRVRWKKYSPRTVSIVVKLSSKRLRGVATLACSDTFYPQISCSLEVEPRGFEPLTSAVQSQNPTVAGVRHCSKIPAK